MEKLKKPYTAPVAELLLLAPAEAVAATETSQDNQLAMNQWGLNSNGSTHIASANISGSYQFGEDGKIK